MCCAPFDPARWVFIIYPKGPAALVCRFPGCGSLHLLPAWLIACSPTLYGVVFLSPCLVLMAVLFNQPYFSSSCALDYDSHRFNPTWRSWGSSPFFRLADFWLFLLLVSRMWRFAFISKLWCQTLTMCLASRDETECIVQWFSIVSLKSLPWGWNVAKIVLCLYTWIFKINRVVTFMLPVEVFATGITIQKCAWLLDRSLLKLSISWVLTGERSDCSHVFLILWFRSLEATLIPWSALKKGLDHLIQFWSRS